MELTPHPAHPSLLWDGEKWHLRKKTKLRPGYCTTYQCRHKMTERSLAHRNVICSKCMTRRARANNPILCRFNWIRDRCKKKGYQFDLTLDYLTAVFVESPWYDELWIQCFLPLSERVTVDRIVPVHGYTMGNIQLLRGSDNYSKKDTPGDQPF